MKHRQGLWVFLSFFAGIAVAIVLPRLTDAAAKRWVFPEEYTEVARVTSPDGVVDAVMQETNCGAPCSSVYYVSIVQRGGLPQRDPLRQVFVADDMVNPQIRWQEPHLLAISYDRALIHEFRNLAYPFARAGDVGSWDYMAEIRLVPSSTRFSYLEAVGGGKRPSN